MKVQVLSRAPRHVHSPPRRTIFIKFIMIRLWYKIIETKMTEKAPSRIAVPSFEIVQDRTLRPGIEGVGVDALEAAANRARDLMTRREAETPSSEPKLDRLTQLPSREMFGDFVMEYVATHSLDDEYIIAFVDLDNFGVANSIDHDVGDKVLKIIANKMKDSLNREGEFIARRSGDEFYVFSPVRDDADDGTKMREYLRKKFSEAKDSVDGGDYDNLIKPIGFSVGIDGVVKGRDVLSDGVEVYIKQANQAMKSDKKHKEERLAQSVNTRPA